MKRFIRKEIVGFSLIELAVAMTIIAVMLGMSVTAFNSQLKATSLLSAESRLEENRIALLDHFDKTSQMPCPSDPTLDSGDVNFGVASASCDVGDVCPTGLTCSGISVQGDFPFKTLGLTSENINDGYGNKIMYAVDRSFTRRSSGYCQANARIVVQDYNSNTASDTVMYVLVSHGEDEAGARSFETGNVKRPCVGGNKDGENCDGDDVFRISDLKLNPSTATNHYDDIVTWGDNPQRKTCPAGLDNCFAWYDAADTCSIYTSTGTSATAWFDKASDNSSRNLVAPSAAEAPALTSSGPNGLSRLVFDGVNDRMYGNGFTSLPNTGLTVVNVFRTTDTAGLISLIASDTTYTASGFSYVFRMNGTQVGIRLWPDPERLSGGVYNDGQPHYAVLRIVANDPLRHYADGGVFFSGTLTTGGTFGHPSVLVGAHSSVLSGGYYGGDVLEIIYFDKKLTNYEMEVLDTYIKEKWGI